MRIVLTGLGMEGKPQDIPESSGFRFYMVLRQPLQAMTRYTSEVKEFHTLCSFEWNGKYHMSGAREYTLVDIKKI